MDILVIGGTGFIGRPLVRELVRLGHTVTVLHRAPRDEARTGGQQGSEDPEAPSAGAAEIFGDRRRAADLASAIRAVHPDIVVDGILSSGTQARHLVTACRGIVPRVVALSSMDVYRACGVTHNLEQGPPDPLPLTEASALRTNLQTYPPAQVQMLQQIFGWLDEEYDKIPVEREILGDRGVAGTVLRLPMVYGPGDRLHRFWFIVKRVLDGRRVILFPAGMAQWRATKGYVENVAGAIAAATVSAQAAGQIYNVGESDTLSELEWAQSIARVLGWDGAFRVLPDDRVPAHLRQPGNTAQHWVADTTKIRRELGVEDAISREEAIRATVDWQRGNWPLGFTPHRFDYAAEDL